MIRISGIVLACSAVVFGRRLFVEATRVIGPILLWRRAEHDQGLHRGADVRAGVARPTEEIARCLVGE